MIFMDQWCPHHNGRHHRLLMIRTINHGINQLDNSFFHYFSDDSVLFMSCCYCCRECCLSLAFSTKRLHYILYLFGPWILFGLFFFFLVKYLAFSLKTFLFFPTFLVLQNIWDEACYGIQIMKWLFITTFIINFSLCFLTHSLIL